LRRHHEAAFQFDLPYVRPADALAALQHAVSPRNYDPSERFTPLLGLTQFHGTFDGNRFRFRCAVGRRPLLFDVNGEVRAAPSGGTTLHFATRLAYPWARYIATAAMMAWFGFFGWTSPGGIGFVLLAMLIVFAFLMWPAYVRTCQQDLETRLRELRPFLSARTPP
jgi:hypothetical protein